LERKGDVEWFVAAVTHVQKLIYRTIYQS